MIRVIFNQKGGVGKTSITCNLAAVSAAKGNKVVVIDLDIQQNATHYLLGNLVFDQTIADFFDQSGGVFYQQKNVTHFVYETQFDNLFLIPSSDKLLDIERNLESRYKIYKLRDALATLNEIYDEIYIDTPPSFNFYTKSALIGADSVLIPFDCDTFSRQSLDKVTAAIMDICEDHNPDLVIEGIIANQFQPRAKLPRQLVEEISQQGYRVLPVKLTSSVKMRESHHASKPLIFFAPSHDLTKQFIALFDALRRYEPPPVPENSNDASDQKETTNSSIEKTSI